MINLLIKLVRQAGIEILNIYESDDFCIKFKKDNSPLTKADSLSNKILSHGLKKIKSFPILSEEHEFNYDERKGWKKFWIIDPLDGTKDFIEKNNEFTINIALIENNLPTLGLIYAPALGDLYWASKNEGAFKNGKKIFNNSKRGDLIGTHSRFHSNIETVNFFKLNKISKIKRFGSALKFCKLAEGNVDVYPRYTGSMEWDTAAGDIILKESGCDIISLENKKQLTYNKKSLLNDFFVSSRSNLFQNIKT